MENRISPIRHFLIAVCVSVYCSSGHCDDSEFLIVERGAIPVPIIIPAESSSATSKAAHELADYLEKISGSRPELFVGVPERVPDHAIWVGLQKTVRQRFPDVDFDFKHPEEILISCNGRHLVIAGRDRMVAEPKGKADFYGRSNQQSEYGTANAVSVFLQKHLDVRWLWPGPLGEDVVKKDRIAFAPFEYRFHPPLRMRHTYRPQLGAKINPHINDWFRRQCASLFSRQYAAGHSFTDWWEKYHEQHPDWFALRGDGTRTPEKWGPEVKPEAAKLCVSNPEVQAHVLDVAEAWFREDPQRFMFGATPNDGGGFCTCKNCRAWDPPNAPPLWGYVSLTDRYVKFWNILARGLKERLPGRDVSVGTYAYTAYFTPPVVEKLEPNIILGYVGHFPLTSDAIRKEQKEGWAGWARSGASQMWYRPNFWYWTGGIWGLPEVSMQGTIEDFRFLADNSCVGLEIDGYRGAWATQGPEYYMQFRLAFDPYQDGQALLKDYYERGFGPASGEIEEYWTLMEQSSVAVRAHPDFKVGSAKRYELVKIFEKVYTMEMLNRADAVLKAASAKAAAGPKVYRERIEFVRHGFEYTRLMMQNLPLMTRARESKGADTDAVKKALANWKAIEKTHQDAGVIALISYPNLLTWLTGKAYMGGMQDYFGPPSKELQKAAYKGPGKLEDTKARE